MAAPALASWQPPMPAPGELELAFAPLGPTGQAVLRAMDAYPGPDANAAARVLRDAIARHQSFEFTQTDPVPYEWQVGRFVRHALDTNNVAALIKLAGIIRGTGHEPGSYTTRRKAAWHHPGSEEYHTTSAVGVVLLCLEFSLHPDKATAVRLFKDVVEALPREEIGAWTDFIRNVLDRAFQGGWTRHANVHGYGHGGNGQPMTWKRWLQLQEFLAKFEQSAAIGSPFSLTFSFGPNQPDDFPFAVLRIYAYAFMQHVKRVTAITHVQVHALQACAYSHLHLGRDAVDFDMDACTTLIRHLDHFIDLHQPASLDPDDGLQPAQSNVIQLLANHLASKQLADPHTIPHIMDFVRAAPAAGERVYRQAEQQAASAAVGNLQLARAHAQTTAAAMPPSATTPARAREDDDEQAAAAAAAPASKRRA